MGIFFCFLFLIILSLTKKWWSPLIAINFIITVYLFSLWAIGDYYPVRERTWVAIEMAFAFPIIVLMATFLAGTYSLIGYFLIKSAYRKYFLLLFILFPYLLFTILSLSSGGIENGFEIFRNFVRIFIFYSGF